MTTRQRRVIEALESQLAEERGNAAKERERFMAILAEEQRKAAEERRQLLATIEALSERLAEGRNGEGESVSE